MRPDAGVSGDAQRIEQMTWLFFLKVYDTQEATWEYKARLEGSTYTSIIPEHLRWRNWAVDNKDGKAPTGDDLLNLVNNQLFPTLKNLEITRNTPFSKAVVKEVFADLNQYMKNGIALRQVINVINEMELDDAHDRHLFGDIYEEILKNLQSAGSSGEFYTPRALTDFVVEMLQPQIGETVADFACGTGGFLTSALKYLEPQVTTPQHRQQFQNAVKGREWKPLPYLLAVTNLLLHDMETPNIMHGDSLATKLDDISPAQQVDVIAMNPPFGGSTESNVKHNFPTDMRSSETADLFMALIMYSLKPGGRAGVIIPDGFLFGTDGAKLAIKTKMLKEFNLHTVIRLPGSIFAPYTTIATNILFFNNEHAKGAPQGYATKGTWFYRLDKPQGYKHFSKTRPMKSEHCNPIREWWQNRHEIITNDADEKARYFTVQELIEGNCNLDLCKFPKDEEEVPTPTEILTQYYNKRKALEKEIDDTLAQIQNLLTSAR